MSCNPVKSPVNCGYHLPHFRDGDLNPGSSDNLPKSPQVVGSAGFDPRWYDTTAPCCGLRWRVKQILALASCAIAFWKMLKTPVEMRFVPEWKWGRYWSRKHISETGLLVHRSPRTARMRLWARPSTYGTNTAGPRSTPPEHSWHCGQSARPAQRAFLGHDLLNW